jgi:hypothetical protein
MMTMRLMVAGHAMMFREADGGETGAGSAPAIEQGEARPEWLPEKFWVEGKPAYEQMAASYRGLEQLLGKKAGAVMVPTERSTPEEVAAFRKTLGVPERPDDYKLAPEELPEGVQVREENLRKFAEIAHAHNIPSAAMQAIVGEFVQQRLADGQAQEATVMQQREESLAVLREDLWRGQDFTQNMSLAKRAANWLGIDVNSPGLADPHVVAGLVKAARVVSDDKLHRGEDVSSMVTWATRAKSIRTNPQDPLYQKYQDGDPETVALARQLDTQM